VPEDVRIVNPLNEEINVMRRALVPSLYRNLVYNFRAGNETGRLFELGVSSHKAAGRAERYPGTGYGEEARLAFCVWGGDVDLWGRKSAAEPVMSLKGLLEAFMRTFGIAGFSVKPFGEGEVPEFLHPGKAAAVFVNGAAVGFIGSVHPSRLQDDKVRVGAALAELSLEKLMAAVKAPKFQELSSYPQVERDIAFVADSSVPAGDMIATLQKTARGLGGEGALLRETRVFDVFEGASLGEGKRSVAIRMVFQSLEGTLEDETVNTLRGKLVDAVCQKHGAVVRG
jgi:phenylalanyl-tRNA synthetase beta chain